MSHLSHYIITKTIGTGAFGRVKRKVYAVAKHILTKEKVAIKVINKSKVKSLEVWNRVKREIKLQKLFHHPHLIRL